MNLLVLAGAAAAASRSPTPTSPPPPPQLAFRHSWDTLPVAWFSANTTGPESAAEMALISNYSAGEY